MKASKILLLFVFFGLTASLSYAQRQPIIGGDLNDWGRILLSNLNVTHTENGTLKAGMNISVENLNVTYNVTCLGNSCYLRGFNLTNSTFPASSFTCGGTDKISSITLNQNGSILVTCSADTTGSGFTAGGTINATFVNITKNLIILGTVNSNLTVSGMVNATQLNGSLDCTNLYGGSDSDFCADATGSGSTNPFNSTSNLIYLNNSENMNFSLGNRNDSWFNVTPEGDVKIRRNIFLNTLNLVTKITASLLDLTDITLADFTNDVNFITVSSVSNKTFKPEDNTTLINYIQGNINTNATSIRADAINFGTNLSFNNTLINQFNKTWVTDIMGNNSGINALTKTDNTTTALFNQSTTPENYWNFLLYPRWANTSIVLGWWNYSKNVTSTLTVSGNATIGNLTVIDSVYMNNKKVNSSIENLHNLPYYEWIATAYTNATNFTKDYAGMVAQVGYKKGNLTLDYPNLDTDNTNDVTSVTGVSPITSSGGTTPSISINADGIVNDTELSNNISSARADSFRIDPNFTGQIPLCSGNQKHTSTDGNTIICAEDSTVSTNITNPFNSTSGWIYTNLSQTNFSIGSRNDSGLNYTGDGTANDGNLYLRGSIFVKALNIVTKILASQLDLTDITLADFTNDANFITVSSVSNKTFKPEDNTTLINYLQGNINTNASSIRADAINFANNLSYNNTLINQFNKTWVTDIIGNNSAINSLTKTDNTTTALFNQSTTPENYWNFLLYPRWANTSIVFGYWNYSKNVTSTLTVSGNATIGNLTVVDSIYMNGFKAQTIESAFTFAGNLTYNNTLVNKDWLSANITSVRTDQWTNINDSLRWASEIPNLINTSDTKNVLKNNTDVKLNAANFTKNITIQINNTICWNTACTIFEYANETCKIMRNTLSGNNETLC